MKTIALVLSLVVTVACQSKQNQSSSTHDQSKSESFIHAEQTKIEQHAKILVSMGRMSSEYAKEYDLSTILGRYDWYGDGNGYFGAYSFYEPAFEQAKRAWFMHGKVLEGSNEFWPQDDWDSDKQANEIKFDNSVVGYSLPAMNMSWFEKGKYASAWFTAKIIGISKDGHAAILDRRAPHQAEQWSMAIVPSDWQDLCACTNNAGNLQFSDGQPVASPLSTSTPDSR